jgi:hypothetical protein
MADRLGGSTVFNSVDLDRIMKAIELSDPSHAPSFYVLRVALGIQTETPTTVWGIAARCDMESPNSNR